MKRFLLTLTLCALMSTPGVAVLVVEFSPGTGGGATAGGWSYDGAGTLSFNQAVQVDLVNGSGGDPLVAAFALVQIPAMSVGGIPGGPYTLSGGPFAITDSAGSILYLAGTLSQGDLFPIGTTAAGYTVFKADITGVTVTAAGLALGSPALNYISSTPDPQRHFDFEMSLQGSPSAGFKDMLETEKPGGDGFSGAMTIPEPATLLLLGIGSLALLRNRWSR
ncbi:MAG: PEP-CTERM sorting domain-containing protein [Phycisphaerae bacterium]|nr:PEP-CTERM sorting domain-containing protein [Phycisphaerae bacterium]